MQGAGSSSLVSVTHKFRLLQSRVVQLQFVQALHVIVISSSFRLCQKACEHQIVQFADRRGDRANSA